MVSAPLNGLTVGISGIGEIISSSVSHIISGGGKHGKFKDLPAHASYKFHSGFEVMRDLNDRLTYHTVESVQTFSNTKVPSPPWVRVIPSIIPSSTCAIADSFVEKLLGEECETVFGGREWWKKRDVVGGGVEAEWIAMKKDWDLPKEKDVKKGEARKVASRSSSAPSVGRRASGMFRKATNDSANNDATTLHSEAQSHHYTSDLDSLPCVLYIHGGGFYWGSIETHRYTIWRHAKKIGGRCFAVKYRLAPQYPFPGPLADCLAAYLYLIDPPEGSRHGKVDPSRIIIMGDSAGGNLALALTCLLRDLSLPPPSSCILISPWLDLTHSFPSVLSNVPSDFLPHYGFVHKPSSLWPVDSPAVREEERIYRPKTEEAVRARGDSGVEFTTGENAGGGGGQWIEVEVDGKRVELKEQIQMYATNEQLCHPYVSPLFQPSLGSLPPLLFIAGDKERLRDEIVYAAHRAGNPKKYQLAEHLRVGRGWKGELNEKRKKWDEKPSLTQLQVYDGVCHDLVLFSWTNPAKYLFRSIASFGLYSLAMAEGGGVQKIGSRLSTVSVDVVVHGPKKKLKDLDKTIYTGLEPLHRPPFVDSMIRERVSVHGVIRPLEAEDQLEILEISPNQIGLIRKEPVQMYLEGFARRDKRWKKNILKIKDERARNTVKFEQKTKKFVKPSGETVIERPPPGSIAARKDTAEALKLAQSLATQEPTTVTSKVLPQGLTFWSAMADLSSDTPTQATPIQEADEPAGLVVEKGGEGEGEGKGRGEMVGMETFEEVVEERMQEKGEAGEEKKEEEEKQKEKEKKEEEEKQEEKEKKEEEEKKVEA